MRCIRARCLYGGPAPCFDDLCWRGDTTMCGLEAGFDFCRAGMHAEDCPVQRQIDDEHYS